jgi:hypothetical protein
MLFGFGLVVVVVCYRFKFRRWMVKINSAAVILRCALFIL